MAAPPDLSSLRALPINEEGPVFREPWEAQAFAMAVKLHEQGHFSWTDWAKALSAEIESAQRGGDPDSGDTYYHHWLAALEKLCVDKGITSRDALVTRKQAWDRAARATPHGEPIELAREICEGKHDV